MAIALSNSTQINENLETYCLIWLDASVNSSSENRHAQQKLQTIINHLLTFDDDRQCLQYIKNLSKDDRIILIVSGRSGRQIVPQINNLRQISSIYIYCFDKKANEQWSKDYTKVKGVLVRLDELYQQIQKDYIQQQHMKIDETLIIKIYDPEQISTNFNDDFINSQLLIDCLIRMKSSLYDKNQFISFCKQYYKNNYNELMIINEFEKDYSSKRSIWWYTRYSFITRLLNKALREENIDLLYLFRFIIHDIGYQLGENRYTKTIYAYRSQLMAKEEFQILKNSYGKYISINSFLSADIDREKTRLYLDSNNYSNDIEKILFEIQADPRMSNMKSFNDIQLQNFFSNKKEILFMIGSIFYIDQIERSKDGIWNIRLILCSADSKKLKIVFEQMKNILGIGETNLLRFGHILRQMGKLNHAEKYSRRYINQLPNNHSDIPHCYYAFGIVGEMKKNFISSLKWYKKSLDILLKLQKIDDPIIVDLYNNIANVYAKTNDYTNAIISYEKVLEILMKTSNEKDSRIIKCLNNIGVVYEMKKKYSDALDYYHKALDLSKKTLSSKHSDIAMTNRNIANVYEVKGDYQQALTYYEKSIKIFRHSLPSSQVYINDIEKSIRRISPKKS